MGDGPPHVLPAHRECLLGEVVVGRDRAIQRLVQLDEPLRGHGGQQLRLVGEVPIGRGRADARAPGDLAQRETLRTLLLNQLQCRIGQCALEISVVVRAPLGVRG